VHPDYLLDVLTSKQLSEWEAYDRIDPIGTWREDFRMAQICCVVANSIGGGKKDGNAFAPMDFMPNWSGEKVEPPKQSAEEMADILKMIADNQNKKAIIDKRDANRKPRTHK
jgi:hypothetical protein